jgi:hypothetical protein
MILPEYCVTCGADAAGGRRFGRTLFYVPQGLRPVIPGRMMRWLSRREPLDVTYSLCDRCFSKSRVTAPASWAAWLAFVVLGAISIVTEGAPAALAGTGVFFVVAVAASIAARSPLRVVGFDKGFFGLEGACPAFLARLGRLGD